MNGAGESQLPGVKVSDPGDTVTAVTSPLSAVNDTLPLGSLFSTTV